MRVLPWRVARHVASLPAGTHISRRDETEPTTVGLSCAFSAGVRGTFSRLGSLRVLSRLTCAVWVDRRCFQPNNLQFEGLVLTSGNYPSFSGVEPSTTVSTISQRRVSPSASSTSPSSSASSSEAPSITAVATIYIGRLAVRRRAPNAYGLWVNWAVNPPACGCMQAGGVAYAPHVPKEET
jgi:hypothetical protein